MPDRHNIEVLVIDDGETDRRSIRRALERDIPESRFRFSPIFHGEDGEPFTVDAVKRRWFDPSRDPTFRLVLLDNAWSEDEARIFKNYAALTYPEIRSLPDEECPSSIRLLREVGPLKVPLVVWTWNHFGGWNKYLTDDLGVDLTLKKETNILDDLPRSLEGFCRRFSAMQRLRLDRLQGHSKAVEELRRRIRDVVVESIKGNILLLGEPGSGKGLVADIIGEALSEYGEYIKVDCGQLAESTLESNLFGHVKGAFTDAHSNKTGVFRVAHRGVLFLDEIGSISPHFQARLQRAILEGEITPVGSDEVTKVDVRVVTATNRDLDRAVEAMEFREDLLQKLSTTDRIRVPSLVERIDDIPTIALSLLEEHLRVQLKPRFEFADDAIECLQELDWNGLEGRDLARCIGKSVGLADKDTKKITADDLVRAHLDVRQQSRASAKTPISPGVSENVVDEYEARRRETDKWLQSEWRSALDAHSGDTKAARRALGVTPKEYERFRYLLRKLGD